MKCIKCFADFELRDDFVKGDYLHDCCPRCKERALAKRRLRAQVIEKRELARSMR